MTDTDDDKPIKALYDHCVTVYEAMFEDAAPEIGGQHKPGETTDEATGYMIWTGHTTQLFASLGMATPYYTTVMRTLKKMGCVEQVKRGGGNAQSKWRLIRDPEEEFFHVAEKIKTPPNGTQAALEQQVRSLSQRVLAQDVLIKQIATAGAKTHEMLVDLIQTGHAEV